MKAWRGFAAAILAAIGLCAALGAGAGELKAGRDFRVIDPPLVAGLTGVPGGMVHGRYLALTTGNYDEMLANIDPLIGRVRAEAGRK